MARMIRCSSLALPLVLASCTWMLACGARTSASVEPRAGAEPVAGLPAVIVEAPSLAANDENAQTEASTSTGPELDWRAVEDSLSGKLEHARLRTSYGPEQAWFGAQLPTLTAVVFVDYSCPHCEVADTRLRALVAAHPDDLRVVVRMYPLAHHERSEPAARAALAAHLQGQFLAMHQALFAASSGLDERALLEQAEQIGLDTQRFEHERRAAQIDAQLEQDRLHAEALGLMGVPTIYLNGRPVDSVDVLAPMVDEELALTDALANQGIPRREIWARIMAASAAP